MTQYLQDFTKAQNSKKLLQSMLQQNQQPVQGANLGTALGKIMSAYFLTKGMNSADASMSQAKQGQEDSDKLDVSRIRGALTERTPYVMDESEKFPGEKDITGLYNEGNGHNVSAALSQAMLSNNPRYRDMGMKGMLAPGKNPNGKYQPGDYTAETWAEYLKTGNPGVLVKDTTGRLIKVDRGDEIQFLHPVTGSVVKTEKKQLAPTETLDYVKGKKTTETQAAADVKLGVEQEANAVTYKAFKAGMEDYSQALEGTLTGFAAGRLPAVTASQQIADGAKSVMLPLLKQLFRSAGEGVFTDKDQELLEGMLPTRKDHPEAARAKIAMVEKVVSLKLGLDYKPPGAEERPMEDLTNEELQAIIDGN